RAAIINTSPTARAPSTTAIGEGYRPGLPTLAPMTDIGCPPRAPSATRRPVRPARRATDVRWLLVFLPLALPLVLGALRLAAHLGSPFTPAGDAALLEVGTRRALAGTQRLGPYSRFGWHQLGPAVFHG